jgi:hypothetical protein
MKILSWDVGIINLSYCILDYNKETNEKKILKWGIINLIDTPDMKKNMNLVFENIPRKLNENHFLLDVDYVVIENQPSLKNPKMKSIQMIVYSYFLMYGKILNTNENKIQQIDFCNASNKLKVYKGPVISLDDLKRKKKKTGEKQTIEKFLVNEDKTEVVDEEVGEVVEEEVGEVEIEGSIEVIKPIKEKKIKLSYTDKKKMAVEHVKYFLKEYNDDENLQFFMEHKKKDDLADSYLQGLFSIINKCIL